MIIGDNWEQDNHIVEFRGYDKNNILIIVYCEHGVVEEALFGGSWFLVRLTCACCGRTLEIENKWGFTDGRDDK